MRVPEPGKLEATAQIAASTVSRLARERWLARHRAWQETRASYPGQWRDAAEDSEFLLYVTSEELKELNQELEGMLALRYRDRLTDPSRRPPGAAPVELLLLSYPVAPPQRPAAAGDA